MLKMYHLRDRPYSPKNSLSTLSPWICFVLGVLLVLQLTLILGCTREEPVKIGFIGGLTGRVADLGISGRNGVILAIEQTNKRGGINGRPVQLIAADDKQDAGTAVREFNSLLNRGVEAVIGHMTSSMSVATVPIANTHHMVLMSPTTTTTLLKDINDYFFRICATTDVYGRETARYFRSTKQLASVTVVYDLGNREYTESWISSFSDEFTRLGGRIVQRITYTSGPETHFIKIAQQALQEESEGIIISSSAVDAAMICQQIRKINTSIPIGTSEWAGTEKLIELGGVAVEGLIVPQFFERYSSDPRYMTFRKNFMERFGQEPGFASVGGYDAANIVLEALAGKKPDQDLKETILSMGTFQGVQDKITFNQYGDSERKTYRSIIRNGRFLPLETEGK